MTLDEQARMACQKVPRNPQFFPVLRDEASCPPGLPWHSHADRANCVL